MIVISFIEIFKFWVHIMIFIVSWPPFALRAAGDGVLKSTRRTIFVHPPLFLKTETKIFPHKSPSPIQMNIQEHNHDQEPWGPKYWQFDHALGSSIISNNMNWIRIGNGYQNIPDICHFFTLAIFLENKIYTEKTRILQQNTQ